MHYETEMIVWMAERLLANALLENQVRMSIDGMHNKVCSVRDAMSRVGWTLDDEGGGYTGEWAKGTGARAARAIVSATPGVPDLLVKYRDTDRTIAVECKIAHGSSRSAKIQSAIGQALTWEDYPTDPDSVDSNRLIVVIAGDQQAGDIVTRLRSRSGIDRARIQLVFLGEQLMHPLTI